jgi:hypothetical protein
VVEGQPRSCLGHNILEHCIDIAQHLNRRDPQGCDAAGSEPIVSPLVARRPVAPLMSRAIDFDREPSVAAVEVENINSGGMLPPKLEPAWPLSKRLPEQHFRQGHLAAKLARISNRSVLSLWRNVLEHVAGPSTMLRMVPLPETSSGRNWSYL